MKELVIIDDLGGNVVPVYAIEKLTEIGLRTVRAKDISRQIPTALVWKKADRQTTLVVFPGNGAAIVRAFLPNEWLGEWRCATCYASRIWNPPEPPRASVGLIEPAYKLRLDVQTVVVIDDVISSGETMLKLRRLNLPWIPNSHWHAIAWVGQRATSTIRGFESVTCVEAAGTPDTKAAINSLSTFMEKPGVAMDYAKRNFAHPQRRVFHKAVWEIKTCWLLAKGINPFPPFPF